MRTAWKASLVLAAVVSLAGCTPAEQDSPERARSTPTANPAEEPAQQGSGDAGQAQGECTAEDFTVSGAPGQEPEFTIPQGCEPPAELLSEDLTPGQGAAVRKGDTVAMQYKLVTWSDKQEKDSSWSRGEPFETPIGAGKVIPGWDEGLIGMKQGGRRLLVVPPEKGYGPQGSGPIKPNETLVFVVDAVRVG